MCYLCTRSVPERQLTQRCTRRPLVRFSAAAGERRSLDSSGYFVAILSVDLAYKTYSDIGLVVLDAEGGKIHGTSIKIPLDGDPFPDCLAEVIDDQSRKRGIEIVLLDGPQGWKAENNGLVHSRVCERQLNTPAKTGLPETVKPANYQPFVMFSIAVFDSLTALGWNRLSTVHPVRVNRTVIESFPLSAWRSLALSPLPAKSKTKPADITSRLASLEEVVPLSVSGTPTHDELQAIVSGLAGLAFERGESQKCALAGISPSIEGRHWREGFIVNPTRLSCKALSNTALEPSARTTM